MTFPVTQTKSPIFENLTEHQHFRGSRYEGLFENGYGVSVVPETDGKHYELAVLKHEKRRKVTLTYDTVVTDDVLRYCTFEGTVNLIERIRNFPQRTTPLPRPN